MESKLLTPDQVSELLGVNTHTLAVWRSSGRYNCKTACNTFQNFGVNSVQ